MKMLKDLSVVVKAETRMCCRSYNTCQTEDQQSRYYLRESEYKDSSDHSAHWPLFTADVCVCDGNFCVSCV
jgi:hypothetical protein